jgi:hypothetical protein
MRESNLELIGCYGSGLAGVVYVLAVPRLDEITGLSLTLSPVRV